jgi:DNA mismatch endonuclease (patch repair protein)
MRDPKITHRIMSSIKSKNTRPELILRKALWRKNLRYRINYKKLPGKPDIVFTKKKIVIFCDGDFWHGHNWALRGLSSLEDELNGYSEFWRQKILRNIKRDNEINKDLTSRGWTVIRIWESDIKKDVNKCVDLIEHNEWRFAKHYIADFFRTCRWAVNGQ